MFLLLFLIMSLLVFHKLCASTQTLQPQVKRGRHTVPSRVISEAETED